MIRGLRGVTGRRRDKGKEGGKKKNGWEERKHRTHGDPTGRERISSRPVLKRLIGHTGHRMSLHTHVTTGERAVTSWLFSSR